MALLYDVIEVSGRLQYITHDSLARDFQGDQLAAIHLMELPDEQDAVAQLGFITAQLPTCIAGFGGSYHDGSQWVITFERGPLVDGDKRQAVQDLRLHLAHMSTLNPSIKVTQEIVLTRDRLLDHYLQWPGIGMPGGGLMLPHGRSGVNPRLLGFTDLLRGVVVEACGYSLTRLCRGYPYSCGFPEDEHVCTGDVFTDALQAWFERRIAPGDEAGDGYGEVVEEPVAEEPQPEKIREVRCYGTPRGPMPPIEELRREYEAYLGREFSDWEIEEIWRTGLI